MDKFDVFHYDLEFGDKTGSKLRPVAVIGIASENVDVVGIYSYRRWFKESGDFYEIIDLAEAGLNRRSFVKTSEVARLGDISKDAFEVIGHLTDRDIEGLMQAIENLDN